MKVILASKNQHKLTELSAILSQASAPASLPARRTGKTASATTRFFIFPSLA